MDMRYLSRIAGFAAMAVAFAVPAAGQTRPNIILITIDTLRADYLGCYGNTRIPTPNLDALAAQGTIFDRAYCQAPMTPPSHASILTGTYPPTHGVRDFTSSGLRAGFPTLASILKRSGYNTAAFVSAYVLDSVWGFNQGFDYYYDHFEPKEFQGVNPGNVQRKAGETITLANDWLSKKPRTPYFLWVHLFDPHHDYNPPEPFHSRYASDLYGGEVAYADHELGRLFDALRANGDWDRSLIVAVSDHGEGRGEHEEYEHGFFLYEATLRIPLIVKLPKGATKQAPRIRDVVASVDIAPTIVQVAQAQADRQVPMQGRGLLAQVLGKGGASASIAYGETLYPRTTFGWSELAAFVEGNFKYIEAPSPELYDLVADPEEQSNLYATRRAMADGLRQKLNLARSRMANQTGAASSTDSERIEALRALGYVAVSVPIKQGPGQPGLADPKDKIGQFNKVLLALQATDAGALSKSSALLGEVIREEPGLFIAHYSLGVNKLKSGEFQAALEDFERARDLNPSFELTELNRATALARLGRGDEAAAILQALVKENPARLNPRRQLALLYTRQKKYEEAISIYRDILRERPGDAHAVKSLGITEVDAGRYAEGSASLESAINLGAADALTYNSLGIAQTNLGNIADAVASYRKALSIKSDYHQARLNLSFALLKAGDTVEARQEFDRLCRENARLCQQYRSYFPK
jgi:arylsulfatase A-like enzyme/Flp pilus assembly protein TadD